MRVWNDVVVVIEGFVPWEALPETGGALDPPVRPLVAALNALPWAHTVFSCAGHPEEPDAGERGRRQAHVDVLVADAGRWRAFVRRVRRAAPAAAERWLRDWFAPGDRGPAPLWRSRRGRAAGGGRLARPPAALAAGGPARGGRLGWPAPGGAGVAAAPAGRPHRRAGRAGAPLALPPARPGAGARTTWRPALCRAVLDAALEAARQALEPEHAG